MSQSKHLEHVSSVVRYSVSVFIVPLSVLAATYSSICREIWLHAGRSPQSQEGNCSPLISRAKMNTVKQMVAVLALYVVCSAPFISAQLWATWDTQAHTKPFFTVRYMSPPGLLSPIRIQLLAL
ncbi:Vasopressin V1a receptor [Zootermopsis nevadensis]|uniref:Vasopressin V1a receptor n=1 Tax=Zootermopsis nevadensis TaxID=136037 RepID=A0A067QGW5_ZOONE|nr:Vasopressin V1a receptor [Zootermopsis nevadensis]